LENPLGALRDLAFEITARAIQYLGFMDVFPDNPMRAKTELLESQRFHCQRFCARAVLIARASAV
jgi:hypothetical protein